MAEDARKGPSALTSSVTAVPHPSSRARQVSRGRARLVEYWQPGGRPRARKSRRPDEAARKVCRLIFLDDGAARVVGGVSSRRRRRSRDPRRGRVFTLRATPVERCDSADRRSAGRRGFARGVSHSAGEDPDAAGDPCRFGNWETATSRRASRPERGPDAPAPAPTARPPEGPRRAKPPGEASPAAAEEPRTRGSPRRSCRRRPSRRSRREKPGDDVPRGTPLPIPPGLLLEPRRREVDVNDQQASVAEARTVPRSLTSSPEGRARRAVGDGEQAGRRPPGSARAGDRPAGPAHRATARWGAR